MTAGLLRARRDDSPDVADEAVITRHLSILPADILVRILRSVHPDLLKQALIPTAAQAGANNRDTPRQKTLRAAKVIYNNRTSVMDCQLRDMSETGCRLRMNNTSLIPRHFELQIAGVARGRLCEARWRTPGEIGVKFVD